MLSVKLTEQDNQPLSRGKTQLKDSQQRTVSNFYIRSSEGQTNTDTTSQQGEQIKSANA